MIRINPIAVLSFCLLPCSPVFCQDKPFLKIEATQTGLAEQYSQALFAPANSARLGLAMLYDQARVEVPGWGSGRDGLRRRAEWVATGYLTRFSTEFAAAKLLGDDTHYQRCLCKGFPRRTTHALHAEFTERRRDGSTVFGTARLAGIYASAAVSESMLPAGRTMADFSNRAVTAIGIDEGFNMLHEFWPEIRRAPLFRRQR